jgi:hypothetical protein
MSGVMGLIRAIFSSGIERREPADLLAFQESRDRMHKSAKRLARAVEQDHLGAMIKRMNGANGKKKLKR